MPKKAKKAKKVKKVKKARNAKKVKKARNAKKVEELDEKQVAKIAELIADNANRPDIIQCLVGEMGANMRALDQYLKENRTLQGMLNMITRRAKEILSAATEAERKTIVKDIETIAKDGIKMLQNKAKE